jgi:hypothetical protein
MPKETSKWVAAPDYCRSGCANRLSIHRPLAQGPLQLIVRAWIVAKQFVELGAALHPREPRALGTAPFQVAQTFAGGVHRDAERGEWKDDNAVAHRRELPGAQQWDAAKLGHVRHQRCFDTMSAWCFFCVPRMRDTSPARCYI